MRYSWCFNIVFFVFIFIAFNLNAQTYNWAKQIGGSGTDHGNYITTDASGNIFITGFFSGTVDFDPDAGIYNLTSAGVQEAYIAKYNAAGNLLWAKRMGGSAADYGWSFAFDAIGNIYIAGYFQGTADFDPGASTFNLISNGGTDIYITKLDATGNFMWAKSMGGPNLDYAYSIALDALGNIYTTGYFESTADFDPSAATFNLTSAGMDDAYISKLDASGNFVWAKRFGGSSSDRAESLALDGSGNVYITGYFHGTADFDPSLTTFNLTSAGGQDLYIAKLNDSGNLLWANRIGGTGGETGNNITIDVFGNVITTGFFSGTVDFDPEVGTFNLISSGLMDVFISKLDSSGNYIWAKKMSGTSSEEGNALTTDALGNIYVAGSFQGTLDFNPSSEIFTLSSSGFNDIFITKLDGSGNFGWATGLGGTSFDNGKSVAIDSNGLVYCIGEFEGTVDFNPGPGIITYTSVAASADIFIYKMNQKGVTGLVYNDLSLDCIRNSTELGLTERRLLISPGNIIVQTDKSGVWILDSLQIGNYSIQADTSGHWKLSCPISQNFTISNTNGITYAPNFGFESTTPCASPEVSITAPFLRRCFSNQKVYVQACNQNIATAALNAAYVDVKLDTLLTVQSASISYSSLGNNTFRFNLGNLDLGQCINFSIDCNVSCNAIQLQTLCMEANLFPTAECVFDSIPDPFPVDNVTPCSTIWDKSSLKVEGKCQNDSIIFTITNTGSASNGNMTCYAPVRIYIDGVFTILDSVILAGGQTASYTFAADGRTWRLEADQHPLHPGNSHPNASIEACGNSSNWTPNLVNILPHDDSDPVKDIYCGLVTGSYDPNDKTGFPLGVGATHNVLPNGDLEYLIRFQNTGTDTAFTVVIRDTLSHNLDIFSIRSGVSSHNYSFKLYGPRIAQWTFNNILLPDSTTNQAASNGFVTFRIKQNSNLVDGTEIKNSADIYFDYNAPIITNQTLHTIDRILVQTNWNGERTITTSACASYTFNNIIYTKSGTYFQRVTTATTDSLITINLTVHPSFTTSTINPVACTSYTAPDGNVYTTSGTKTAIIANAVGCDSIITINLIIRNNASSTINPVECTSYTAPDGIVYTTSGTKSAIIPNTAGCDSIITINLTINDLPDANVTQNDIELNATLAGANYQWIDCSNGNTTILTQTAQNFTATTNGDYAVIITQNGCSTTSACYTISTVGLSENKNNNSIQIFPNPSDGFVTIASDNSFLNSTIKLTTIEGALVYENKNVNVSSLIIDLRTVATGIYFIQIIEQNTISNFKLIKN